MRRKSCYHILVFLSSYILLFAAGCKGQKIFGTGYLQLEKEIPLHGVRGRIDHIDVDANHKIAYIAALGNNTLEIVNLQEGKVIHSITGLDEPQGVAYIPETNEIFVANGGNGQCYFYDAADFKRTGTVALGSDADDVRYDSTTQRVYVGYGSGGIAIIDAKTHQELGHVPLPAHPESFQLDHETHKIFVNIPDAFEIEVIDMNTDKVIDKWQRFHPSRNFPMAIDPQHRVIVGYRFPARLEINNADGRSLQLLPIVGDADDLYYDEREKRIYVSGGGGYINIFQEGNTGQMDLIANIPTRSGARTSYFIPSLHQLIIAARAEGRKDAALSVYKVGK